MKKLAGDQKFMLTLPPGGWKQNLRETPVHSPFPSPACMGSLASWTAPLGWGLQTEIHGCSYSKQSPDIAPVK